MSAATMLTKALSRLAEAQGVAAKRAAVEAEAEAVRQAEAAALEAIETEKRDEAAAVDRMMSEATAELARVEAIIEAERFAAVRAEADAPAKLAAMWAGADEDYATLTATKHYELENFQTQASMAMRAATGLDVPTELWSPVDSNMIDLRDFAGLNFRVWKIRPEMKSVTTNQMWTYMLRVETPSGYATISNRADLAELSKQFPAMRRVAGETNEEN